MSFHTRDSHDGKPEKRPSTRRLPGPPARRPAPSTQATNGLSNSRKGEYSSGGPRLVGPTRVSRRDTKPSAGLASHQKGPSKVDSADVLAEPTRVLRGKLPQAETSIKMGVRELSVKAKEAMSRFERWEDVKDIDEAIEYWTQVLALTPDGHAEKPYRLARLGSSLRYRFERAGELEDVNKAIDYQTQAVQLTPDWHAHKPSWLNNLGNSYGSRFDRLGELADLKKSIDHLTQAVQLTPDGHSGKPTRLNNLGNAYQSRFTRLGKLADLDKAIERNFQAVQLTPDGHPDKPSQLKNLGSSYQSRFTRFGELGDLNKAIEYKTQAVQLTPDRHPAEPRRLTSLGISYEARFTRLGELEDLNKAIEYKTKAVQLTPDGHPDKPSELNNLGLSYESRFRRLGELEDLNKAIEYQYQAVKLTPDGHPGKPYWLNSLGISYRFLFMRLSELADLNKAIEYQAQAVQLTPDGHPDKPSQLKTLGIAYQSRFEHLGELSDLKSAQLSFQLAAELPATRPLEQIQSARKWATSLSKHGCSPQLAYERCMELVPYLIWLGTSIDQRYNLLHEITDLATEAADWAIYAQHYDLALEWLEEGRSIVWNQLLQLRTPFDDLAAADKELAEQLKATALKLENAGSQQATAISSNTTSVPDQYAYQHNLASEWDRLLALARQLQGFEHFLRPRKAAALKLAAIDGPIVVINAHSTHCDALVVLPDSNIITHIPLEKFSPNWVTDHRILVNSLCGHRGDQQRGFKKASPQPTPEERFRSTLVTLWSDVVKPILDSLGYTQQTLVDHLPHVTWCTTGALSFLPLHAAGCYDGMQPNTYDLIVSSYTPTLSALLTSSSSATTPNAGVLAVGQAKTRGFCPLPYTVPELAAIKEFAKAVPFQQLEGENGTTEAVLDALGKYSWVHLACHATQDTANPTQSAFHLYNGNLTLEALTRCSFGGKGLAFLSACQTAAGDEKLPDEAVHLAAGILMAGYPSVIATMWSIYDEDAPGVAGEVYAELLKEGQMDHRQAARALHKAVGKLRERVGLHEYKRWVPFVHIGV